MYGCPIARLFGKDIALMTPQEFVEKWRHVTLKERSAAQEHFLDLCRMLGHKTPVEADPDGRFFTFERDAEKLGGGDGFADVWYRGHFAWEYKTRHIQPLNAISSSRASAELRSSISESCINGALATRSSRFLASAK